MKEFIEMLRKIKPNVDFENEEALVDDGILESLDIISIISEIADKYGVVITSVRDSAGRWTASETESEVYLDISVIKNCVYGI